MVEHYTYLGTLSTASVIDETDSRLNLQLSCISSNILEFIFTFVLSHVRATQIISQFT